MVTIYTDGAARGNPGPGGWAGIIASEERVMEIGGDEVHTTNNRMELTAVIRSLEFAINNFQFSEIQVNTDSEYVMKGITLWVKNWQKKGWKTAGKKQVLNKDLWQMLLLVTEGQQIEWKYVAGHNGDKANERSDEIATSFADGLTIDLYNGPRNSYRYL
ncbi:MAG: ribonuclease HI [Candidatus Zambryskibacteria bacterium]|nr:ribonuclease HI [Candidatus Zambryskibacteria bacterium]